MAVEISGFGEGYLGEDLVHTLVVVSAEFNTEGGSSTPVASLLLDDSTTFMGGGFNPAIWTNVCQTGVLGDGRKVWIVQHEMDFTQFYAAVWEYGVGFAEHVVNLPSATDKWVCVDGFLYSVAADNTVRYSSLPFAGTPTSGTIAGITDARAIGVLQGKAAVARDIGVTYLVGAAADSTRSLPGDYYAVSTPRPLLGSCTMRADGWGFLLVTGDPDNLMRFVGPTTSFDAPAGAGMTFPPMWPFGPPGDGTNFYAQYGAFCDRYTITPDGVVDTVVDAVHGYIEDNHSASVFGGVPGAFGGGGGWGSKAYLIPPSGAEVLYCNIALIPGYSVTTSTQPPTAPFWMSYRGASEG